MLARTSPQTNQLKQLIGTIKSAGNPQAMMNQMIQSNPNYRKAMEYINQNGGDPKSAFYNLAQERGVDPNEILNMLK